MSHTSFCSYFKSRTYKTLFGFINEMHIGQACKLLIDDVLMLPTFNNIASQ